MHLVDELLREHELIDRVAGSFRTYAAEQTGTPDPEDGRKFVRFFTRFAGEYHHAREEDTLFVALVERLSLPRDRGPIAVLADDHRRMGALLARAAELIDRAPQDPRALTRAVSDYTNALAHHIDAENSVLLPESEARLARNGVTELPSRAPTPEESDAMRAAEDLLRRYPPSPGDIVRGDGCVLCPAMGDRCEGLEAAWWNEWEWEEFADRTGAD